jgi:hypothetical protein
MGGTSTLAFVARARNRENRPFVSIRLACGKQPEFSTAAAIT